MFQNNDVESQDVGKRISAQGEFFPAGKIKWVSLVTCLVVLLVAALTLTLGAFLGAPQGAHATSAPQSTHVASAPHKVKSPKHAHSPSRVGKSKPVLSASSLNLSFNVSKGSSQAAATQIVTVSNGGTRVLYWRASVSPSTATWVILLPLKSQPLGIGTSSDKPGQLIVSINPAGLNIGTYIAHITLTGTDQESQPAGGNPQTITVTLKVS